ncbi:MAG: aldehyde dehydrogenase [Bryobacterales bacterium]|nr:aldehyde dehydrogenase [Bryobacterales bacterium]
MPFDPISELSDNVRNRFYIGGNWIESRSSLRHVIVSPATEEALVEIPLANKTDVENAVAAARSAFDWGPWPKMSGVERSVYLRRLSEEIKQRMPLFARLMTAEAGAPVAFVDRLIQESPRRFEYFAELAGTYVFEERRPTPRGHARVHREPIGVAALIAPWNATLNIFAFKIPAALAAGCTVVVKSPPECPFDALLVAECAEAAGIPAGVLNVITADREEGAFLVASPQVDKISFTGGLQAGLQVAAVASERLARVTLELGGKSAAILLDDAELSVTLPTLAAFSMGFSGQMCVAQSRVLVPKIRLDEMVDAFSSMITNLKIGDPWEADTHVGPVRNERQRDRVLDYIQQGIEQGGRVITGGGRSAGFDKGYYLDPTVFTEVTPNMTIAQEEIFGPVVTIIVYDDVQDAVRLANDSRFGLSGTVFSTDQERAYDVACQIKTGHVGVNGLEMPASVPFGGYKFSGIGRGGGPEGLETYLETKAIFMPGPA